MSINKVNAMATHAKNINKITYILGGFKVWLSHSNNGWFKVWLCAQLCDNGGWIFEHLTMILLLISWKFSWVL